MSEVKLSKTQKDLLDAIKSGVRVYFMPYAGRLNPSEYYKRSDTRKKVTKAAFALQEKGLVVRIKSDWKGHELAIKEPA